MAISPARLTMWQVYLGKVNDTTVETSAETSVETSVETVVETSSETPAEKTIVNEAAAGEETFAGEKIEKKTAKKEKSSKKAEKKAEKTIVNETAAGEKTFTGEATTAVDVASDGEETSVEIIEETKEENKKHNLPLAGWLAIGAGALAAAASAIFGINKNKKVKKNQEQL